MVSGYQEGTQDQADQIPDAASQDRTSQGSESFRIGYRHHHGACHARIVNNKDVLSLYRLGSDSVQKFEERRLRSHLVPVQAIYLRCRLVAIIDEPFRTRAISQLRLILEFRKGHHPPTNVPLRLPPLAHDVPASFHCAARTCEFSTVTSSIGQDGGDQGSCGLTQYSTFEPF